MSEVTKDELKRKPRTISMNEVEVMYAENIMYFYRLHSISEAIRFLIIRENGKLEAEGKGVTL